MTDETTARTDDEPPAPLDAVSAQMGLYMHLAHSGDEPPRFAYKASVGQAHLAVREPADFPKRSIVSGDPGAFDERIAALLASKDDWVSDHITFGIGPGARVRFHGVDDGIRSTEDLIPFEMTSDHGTAHSVMARTEPELDSDPTTP
jgi:hypothetical protein